MFAIIKRKYVVFAADVVSGKVAASASMDNASHIAKLVRKLDTKG